jgi:transposase
MKILLTQDQIDKLKGLHKIQNDRRKADRIKIILLLNSGYTQKEVADILLLDQDTITTWKNNFLERKTDDDLSTWLSDNYVGYVGKISFIEITRLRTYLSCFNVGTKARIQTFLLLSEQITYTLSGLQKLLDRIGMSHKKIRRIPGNANVYKQASFIKIMDKIISKMSVNQSIMYMDSVHPQHNTVCSKVWIEKGTQRWIQSNTGRERVNINGAYNPFTQEVFTQQAPTINAQVTIKLLKKIIERNPQFIKIHLVSDNARYNKCKEVQEFLATQTKIQMLYLPPYSPNLNLIERLWKFMHEKVIHLNYFDTFPKFKKAINSFFDNLAEYKEELKNRITFKFQTFDNAKLAIA